MGLKKFKKNRNNKPARKSRKEERKELRKEKKLKKNEYFMNRKNRFNKSKGKLDATESSSDNASSKKKLVEKEIKCKDNMIGKPQKVKKKFMTENLVTKDLLEERKQEVKLKNQMAKQRRKLLIEANIEEDKNIKRLEKQLKMNKRKAKSLPKSFLVSGFDYILDVCDPDKLHVAAATEENLMDSGDEFQEDMATIMGQKSSKEKTKKKNKARKPAGELEKELESTKKRKEQETDEDIEDNESDLGSLFSEIENFDEDELESESDISEYDFETMDNEDDTKDMDNEDDSEAMDNEDDSEGGLVSCNIVKEEEIVSKKKKRVSFLVVNRKGDSEEEGVVQDERKLSESDDGDDDDDDAEENIKKRKSDGTWEDIYGRLRDKQGNIIQESKGKYVAPHLRGKGSNDKKTNEQVRLKKEMKGLLNRLAENNMYSISNQIEDLYMKNSRNDMNETLMSLLLESLISQTLTPERLVMEHAMLVTILHANVGTEIGAYILQSMVKKLDEAYSIEEKRIIENKELDNILLVICHLYNFKVFHNGLLYEITGKLCNKFEEKEVDLIILILRSVGFTLRKDDPVAMKNLLLRVQRSAAETKTSGDGSRVKFMLDVLLTIKNNNMAKLPQYDPTHSEHLKKILRPMLRKGNHVTELNIGLDDLLSADERGKWWVVGSAWTGSKKGDKVESKESGPIIGELSQELLELAKKQRMNTANRRNIFCILMSAEDYLDAFEKLVKMGLRGQPEQEIIHVLLHCLLQENDFNPYYAHIASQLCLSDRRHQMTIQFSVWDKIKELGNLKPNQITNLAKFLAHLFLDKSLPISVLKVLHFAEMDKPCVRLLRLILLSILTHSVTEEAVAVFTRVSKSENLSLFRESLRLFLHHFMLKNMKDLKLRQKAELINQALAAQSRKSTF